MVSKYCQRCGLDMPNWETHDICEACDHELHDEQAANIEADIAQAEAAAYHKYCYEQWLANSHEGEGK